MGEVEARGELGDLCWCPEAFHGLGHYWQPSFCPNVPVPRGDDEVSS